MDTIEVMIAYPMSWETRPMAEVERDAALFRALDSRINLVFEEYVEPQSLRTLRGQPPFDEARAVAPALSDAQKAMFTAMQAKDYAAALKAAEAVLDGEYVNIDAHMVASMAAKQTGADDKADFHRAVVTGLLDSIRHSGDGKSAKTAWVVINTHGNTLMDAVLNEAPLLFRPQMV